MCLDELKGFSDDFTYTEEHVIFLVDKYRAFLIKQKYLDIKKEIPEANYQEICIDLEPWSSSELCGEQYLKSTEKVPSMMSIGNPTIYPTDYYQGINIAYVSRERMRYVGNNKYLKNIAYCSLSPDGYLLFKSSNPQLYYMKKVRMSGIFDDFEKAAELSCNNNSEESCDPLDKEFPLETALVPPLIEMVVKELAAAEYKVADDANNSNDDLADIAQYVRLNTKTPLQKQMGI